MQVGLNAGLFCAARKTMKCHHQRLRAWKSGSPNFYISQQNYEEADCNKVYSAYSSRELVSMSIIHKPPCAICQTQRERSS